MYSILYVYNIIQNWVEKPANVFKKGEGDIVKNLEIF